MNRGNVDETFRSETIVNKIYRLQGLHYFPLRIYKLLRIKSEASLITGSVKCVAFEIFFLQELSSMTLNKHYFSHLIKHLPFTDSGSVLSQHSYQYLTFQPQ